MNRCGSRLVLGVVIVLTAFALAGSIAVAKDKKEKPKPAAEYTAVMLPPADSSNITPSEIIIVIDRFTTPEEKAALRDALEKKGQMAALTLGQKNPIGRLVRAGGRGTDIFYAAKETTDKGERVVVVTQRFPLYPNTIMNADEMKYPFGLLAFYPDAGEKGGEGMIVGVTAFAMDPNGHVDVTGYAPAKGNLAFVKSK
jgi:hypothetical protein